jgi:hypothetical protein
MRRANLAWLQTMARVASSNGVQARQESIPEMEVPL